MANQITRWKPDTCDCIFEYSWDDTVAPDARTHDLRTAQKCVLHAALSDQDAYAAVKDENVTKNKVLGVVLEDYPALVDTKADGAKELKAIYDYIWSFDVDRKLQAEIKGVDKATAQAISASVDAELGSDKVDVKIP